MINEKQAEMSIESTRIARNIFLQGDYYCFDTKSCRVCIYNAKLKKTVVLFETKQVQEAKVYFEKIKNTFAYHQIYKKGK